MARAWALGGVGGAFGFVLTNTAQTTGSVTTTAINTPTDVDGNTGSSTTTAFSIVANTAVTINENTLPVGWQLTGASCVNAASVPVGSLTGSTYTITGAQITASASFTCTFTNSKLPILRLRKALPLGRFSASDQFGLSITGIGGPAAVTTTGASATASGVATISPGATGAVYGFSETAASGANLANYSSSYSCTNALSGGQTPSGSGTSFNVTAAVGDDLTCTLTNTRNAITDLVLTKTNSPGVNGNIDQPADTVISGAASNYTITVTNNGPDGANGAVITDPAPTNQTCSTATCNGAGGRFVQFRRVPLW